VSQSNNHVQSLIEPAAWGEDTLGKDGAAIIQASIAISLKRIADKVATPLNEDFAEVGEREGDLSPLVRVLRVSLNRMEEIEKRAQAVVDARYNQKEWDPLKEAIGSLSELFPGDHLG
jgi:hypothetical protein